MFQGSSNLWEKFLKLANILHKPDLEITGKSCDVNKNLFFLSEIKKIYQVCGYLFFRSITWVNSSVNILSFFSGIAEPIATNLGIKHLWVNRSINCEIHGPCPPWGLRDGAKTIKKIMQFFKKLLLYSWTSNSQIAGMVVISIEVSTNLLNSWP